MRSIGGCVAMLVILSSCGTTNHLDLYPLRGAHIYSVATIDPIPEPSSFYSDESVSFWVRLAVAIASAPFTSHPDPMTRDASLADYFHDGLQSELDSMLWTRSEELPENAQFALNVRIKNCDFVPNDSGCNMRFTETFTIRHVLDSALVFDEDRDLTVPLRYCGSTTDTISQSGNILFQERYLVLSDGEKLSALQCAAFDAGADLADSLISLAQKSAH